MSKNIIKGIHHINIRCSGAEQYNKAVNFYKDILGLDVYKEFEMNGFPAIMLDCGAGYIEIFCDAHEIRKTGIIEHLALSVDDVDRCVNEISKAGYKITKEPTDYILKGKKAPYPARIAFCEGAAGEIIEIFCEL